MSIYKQQRNQVRICIEDTAVRLFKEKGYENVTIEEIAKSVGIAKGTFYNFFSSKFDILILWSEQEFGKFNFRESMSLDRTIKENLDIMIGTLVKAIEKEEKLFRYFIIEIIRVFGDSKFNVKFDFIMIFSLIIKNSKDFNKIGEILFNEKINMLNSTLFLGIVIWFNQHNSVQGLREYLHNMMRVCLCGITTNFEGEEE